MLFCLCFNSSNPRAPLLVSPSMTEKIKPKGVGTALSGFTKNKMIHSPKVMGQKSYFRRGGLVCVLTFSTFARILFEQTDLFSKPHLKMQTAL